MQEPYNHTLPSRAELLAAEAKIKRREMILRTGGIWAFGLVGAAMAGGLLAVSVTQYRDASLGLIGGPCIFGCARLWLAERRQTKLPI